MFDTHVLDGALKVRREKQNRERVELLDRVIETLKEVRERYHIREAYVIGSLLVAYRWCRTSDIDVAVGGCSKNVLDVMKALEETTGKVVDVIDLDTHPFPEGVRIRGAQVYG